MAEKTLNTRIALLYKSYANWVLVKDTYIPLKGEVCFCEVPASTGVAQNEPCVLFKVGDGVKTWSELPWASALAADVYAWAKKEHLEWVDFTDELKESIKEYVGGIESNTLYLIVADGANKWKLQKSEDGGVTWVDATGVIDMTNTVAALESSISAEATARETADTTLLTNINNEASARATADTMLQSNIDAEATTRAAEDVKKVDKQIVGTNGTAEIFNESDGGGAHFIHNDGTEAFVGVNDGGESGMMAQIYADKLVDGSWVGSRINVYHNGIYYVSKANQLAGYAKNAADMEIATKKDIKDLGTALHFVGVATKEAGETEIQAVERTFPAASQRAGAVAICGSKEFICYGSPLAWQEFGDVSAYATKAELEAETNARTVADSTLQTNIDTEASARATADTTLQTNIDTEASARATADTILQSNIDAEASTRETADTTLQSNIDAEAATRATEDAKKVDRQVTLASGAKSYVSNNVGDDGSVLKVEGTTNWSAVAVNDGGDSAIGAQMYDWKMDGTSYKEGTVIDVKQSGAYYYNGDYATSNVRDIAANEIAVKGDVSALDQSLATIAKTGNINDLIQSTGDVLILNCNI